MADVGFDSDKHAQTSGDMEKGGQSLTDSSQAISRLIDAQKAEYWSEEAGFQAMRWCHDVGFRGQRLWCRYEPHAERAV